ncbi:hypothetical protein KFE25_009840 [Diacronema lutheri]|uniref:ABC transporter domain-containing protein n=2 Tax=Diacronema lutheri TaxID=2081491 RepID=A0A8J5X6E9_DIALT|nr:hypothetical protein KFE25_009840 [Diacronema lutheri]
MPFATQVAPGEDRVGAGEGKTAAVAASTEPSDRFFEWRDLSLNIGSKPIVVRQSGYALPGELLVVLGPSGAGKTSLLAVLCGDRPPTTGSVLFQGRALASASGGVRESVRRQILQEVAYVRQRDIFMEALTVEETLAYTARLRMPRHVSRAQKLDRVREVLRELGLEGCAHTTIGSTMRRGVSGGELKRINIANELLSGPLVLVCDEPTSGLDSSCALTVMSKLREYGRKHSVAVICSIHQPSSQIGALFDTALLLVPGGREAYLGAYAQLRPHLQHGGFEPPAEYTLTDYAMELLATPDSAASLLELWERERARVGAARAAGEPCASRAAGARPPSAGFVEQTVVLMQRQLRQSRGTLLARTEVLLSVMVALITGLIWFGAALPGADGSPPSERALLGLVFYCLAHMSWWPMYLYLFSFSGEIAVLAKEKRTGAYSIEAYFCAKLLSESAAELICPTLFFAIALPMVGLGVYASIVLWLVGLLAYQTSSAIGMLISVAAPPGEANMIASTVMTLVMNAGGYLIDTTGIPAGLRWVPFTSYV